MADAAIEAGLGMHMCRILLFLALGNRQSLWPLILFVALSGGCLWGARLTSGAVRCGVVQHR